MVTGWVWLAALAVIVLPAGCYNNAREGHIAGSFSARSGCPLDQISVVKEPGGLLARGCGKSSHYDCFSNGCQPTEELDPAPQLDPPAAHKRTTELRVMVVLEGGDGLFIHAAPQESEDALMLL